MTISPGEYLNRIRVEWIADGKATSLVGRSAYKHLKAKNKEKVAKKIKGMNKNHRNKPQSVMFPSTKMMSSCNWLFKLFTFPIFIVKG
jgi:hypothetical protein